MWEPQVVSWWQWNHAFGHAADTDSAPLSRRLITLGLRAAAEGDGRLAVIHAATAAECALTIGLAHKLSAKHSPEEVQRLMRNHRMLGGRLALALKLGMTVPSDARKSLLDLRNLTLHNGHEIIGDDAWKALAAAKAIVNDFEPLPDHCEEPVSSSVDVDSSDLPGERL
jgi:hypothetical protein